MEKVKAFTSGDDAKEAANVSGIIGEPEVLFLNEEGKNE